MAPHARDRHTGRPVGATATDELTLGVQGWVKTTLGIDDSNHVLVTSLDALAVEVGKAHVLAVLRDVKARAPIDVYTEVVQRLAARLTSTGQSSGLLNAHLHMLEAIYGDRSRHRLWGL